MATAAVDGWLKPRSILPLDVVTKVKNVHTRLKLGFLADHRDERICVVCGYLKELHDDYEG